MMKPAKFNPPGAELPLGFGMALAMNTDAMFVFAAMTEEERQSVLNRLHFMQSKEEMQALVASLAGKRKRYETPPGGFIG